jgi:hypothetical protein
MGELALRQLRTVVILLAMQYVGAFGDLHMGLLGVSTSLGRRVTTPAE